MVVSSTCSDSEAQKLFTCLKIMQAQEEEKAEPGNATKCMTCKDNDASDSSTAKPPTHVNVKCSVSDRAKKLEQTLSQQSPCFVKTLQTSDMHAGMFLDVSENICDNFFPRPEGSLIMVDLVLVDEDDRECEMSYSFRTKRILGKWRQFYLEHKLTSGDALVFNQTGNCKIKVYSMKANEQTEDGQAKGSSTNFDVPDNSHDTGSTRIVEGVKQLDVEFPPVNVQAETATPKSKSNSDSSNRFFQKDRLNLDNEIAGSTRIVKTVKPLDVGLPPTHVQAETATPRSNSNSYDNIFLKERLNLDNKNAGSTWINKTGKPLDVEQLLIDAQPETSTPRSNSNSTLLGDLSDHSSNNMGSDMNVSLHMKVSSSDPNFMEVKRLEDFKICANGEVLDTKIPPEHQKIYYELCNSQTMFLHERVKGVKSNLVVKMIETTIRIAEATKTADTSTSLRDLENDEKDLKSLEEHGMAVGFLRQRVSKFRKLLLEHKAITEFKKRKFDQIENERTAMREEILMLKNLTDRVTTRESCIGYLEVEFATLQKDSRELEFKIKDAVDSAW